MTSTSTPEKVANATAALAAGDATAADDVFAFDVGIVAAIPELLRDFRTPSPLRRAFPPSARSSGAAWSLLSLGPSRAGLPLHAHGETWLAVVHGAKRWFVYAPGDGPARETTDALHPLASARDWVDAVYAGPKAHYPRTCVQRPGDAVFLPAGWKHATLNVGETVAVGEQSGYGAAERLPASLRALEKNPRDVEALHGAGVAAAHLAFDGDRRKFRDAISFLTRAALERPLQPEVNILLGEVLHAAGDPAGAAHAVETCRGHYASEARKPSRVLRGAPSPAALSAVHLKFGRFYMGVENWKRALAPLGDALAVGPPNAEALKDRALALHRLGRVPEAVADLEAALAINPRDPATVERLATFQRALDGARAAAAAAAAGVAAP